MTNLRIITETRADGKQLFSVQYEKKTFWGLRSVWRTVLLSPLNRGYDEVIRYFDSREAAQKFIDRTLEEIKKAEGERIVARTYS